MDSLQELNPLERHKLILEHYILKKPRIEKRDIDVIRENHKFIWDENLPDAELTWREQLARKYYQKLFKEYCICDLSRYKENKVAMRWRTEKEVIAGKGQFVCGHKQCNLTEELRTWEVNFAYIESNEKKNALVKLRLCPKCSEKLNYHSQKREVKRAKNIAKMIKKSKRKSKDKKNYTSDENNDLDEKDSEESNVLNEEIELRSNQDDNVTSKELNDQEAGNIWRNPEVEETEPTRESEFEAYLEDLIF